MTKPVPPIVGVRSIEIEMRDPRRAAEFYADVWHLDRVTESDGSIYLRGTGRYHHILALHPAREDFSVRRLVFDVKDRARIDALHAAVVASGAQAEAPHAVDAVGGGYGFGFADVEGRNYAAVCEVDDHQDATDVPDRPRKIAHVNINAVKLEDTNAFLREVLGFRLIDETPALSFFHGDSSDHNAMVVCRASQATINHVAFEMPDLESVMRGAGRMRDAGYPIEWGVGRHGAGNNVFSYFAGPEEFPVEYTAEVLQIDDSYVPRGPEHWRFPPGRMDQWGVTPPHTARWKRIQNLYRFAPGQYRL